MKIFKNNCQNQTSKQNILRWSMILQDHLSNDNECAFFPFPCNLHSLPSGEHHFTLICSHSSHCYTFTLSHSSWSHAIFTVYLQVDIIYTFTPSHVILSLCHIHLQTLIRLDEMNLCSTSTDWMLGSGDLHRPPWQEAHQTRQAQPGWFGRQVPSQSSASYPSHPSSYPSPPSSRSPSASGTARLESARTRVTPSQRARASISASPVLARWTITKQCLDGNYEGMTNCSLLWMYCLRIILLQPYYCYYCRWSKPYQRTSPATSRTGRANSPDCFRWSYTFFVLSSSF